MQVDGVERRNTNRLRAVKLADFANGVFSDRAGCRRFYFLAALAAQSITLFKNIPGKNDSKWRDRKILFFTDRCYRIIGPVNSDRCQSSQDRERFAPGEHRTVSWARRDRTAGLAAGQQHHAECNGDQNLTGRQNRMQLVTAEIGHKFNLPPVVIPTTFCTS